MNSNSTTQADAVVQPYDARNARPSFPAAILFSVWVIVVIVATLVTFILPESFSSTARIKVERDVPDIQGLVDRGNLTAYDPYFIQTEFELLQSEVVLGKVIEDLDLNREWGKKYANGERLKTQETMTILKGRIDLRPVRNTSLIEIRVYSGKADEAARIANAVAEAYKDHRQEQRNRLSQGGIKALEERFKDQQADVKKAQEKVEALRKELNISDAMASGDGPSPLITAETLRKLEAARIESKAEFVRQAALLNALTGVQRELGPDALAQSISTAAPDAVLSALQERLGAAEQQLVGLRKDYGSNHAEVVKSEAVVEDLRSKIRSRVDGIMLGLSTKVRSLSNSLDNLEQEVSSATKRDVEQAILTRPYFEAKKQLEEQQRFRQTLEGKIVFEKIEKDLPRSMMVEIVDKAVPGFRPVKPNKPLNIALGIIVGFVSGLFLATLVYILQLREFRRASGLPRTPFPPRFRAVVHVLIALVVGLVIGYHLANPFSLSTLIVVPLFLLLGAIGSAYIEMANPGPLPEPAAAPGQVRPNERVP